MSWFLWLIWAVLNVEVIERRVKFEILLSMQSYDSCVNFRGRRIVKFRWFRGSWPICWRRTIDLTYLKSNLHVVKVRVVGKCWIGSCFLVGIEGLWPGLMTLQTGYFKFYSCGGICRSQGYGVLVFKTVNFKDKNDFWFVLNQQKNSRLYFKCFNNPNSFWRGENWVVNLIVVDVCAMMWEFDHAIRFQRWDRELMIWG